MEWDKIILLIAGVLLVIVLPIGASTAICGSKEPQGEGGVMDRLRLCWHPSWGLFLDNICPSPGVMVPLCECGANYSCNVCGEGAGQIPCECELRRRAKEG